MGTWREDDGSKNQPPGQVAEKFYGRAYGRCRGIKTGSVKQPVLHDIDGNDEYNDKSDEHDNFSR